MTLRWGILGTGNIARQFANGVRQSESGVLAAVGSRSIDSARAFAGQFQVPIAHGDYDALLADRDCDALYVSLPNTMHHAWAIKALRAGKHVLCEKPISVTAAEAEEMFDVAHTQGRVLVEAFMYRAHPQTLAVVEAVRSGAIGRIKLIRTSFCYRTKKIDGNIRFDRTLAGGAMMDIGCYCLSFARLIAGGEPVEAKIVGAELVNGVDVLVSGSLKFPGGVLSSFTCGMNTQADNSADICGEEGWITIPVPWKPPAGG
ncbi:MAG: Gfo/Idh/MocA family protein, partial [Tepidisphaeraceae bacterium]